MHFDSVWERRISTRHELLTPAEMAIADAAAMRLGVSTLMENAGRAAARAIQAHFQPCRALILCGPGNNGGDGYVVARLLQRSGWPITLARTAPPRAGSDAANAAANWHGVNVPFTPAEARRADLVVDAIYGAGLTRDVDAETAAVLAACQKMVAIDVPSGLDGATGQVRGYAPKATMTVTFFRLKPGHLLLPGRELCGFLTLADIAMPPSVLDQARPCAAINGPWLWQLPRLAPDGHKYSRGHVTILGGAEMTGAARLAAEAARRAGAGLVTIVPAGENPVRAADLYRAGAPGVIVDEAPIETQLQDDRRKTWVCGPGLGQATARRTLELLLAAGRDVVADADALTAHAGNPEGLRGCAVVTPHDGEFFRLFGPIGPDRLQAARRAAAITGAVVLLKGAATIISSPSGFAAINASAPPWLATAGAGDTLAGIIAGLMAQGMAAFDAAAAAAWLHGHAATLAGAGMLAEDIAPHLAAVMKTSSEIGRNIGK